MNVSTMLDWGGVDAIDGVFRDRLHADEMIDAACWRHGFLIQSADGIVVAAGRGIDERVHGWTPSELVSRAGARLVHPEDVEHSMDARRTALTGAATELVQVRGRTKGGRWLWTEVEYRPFTAADPSLGPMTIALLRDVSEAHLDHDVLALLTELRSLIAAAPTLTDAWRTGLERLVRVGGLVAGFVWERSGEHWTIGHGWSADRDHQDLAAELSGIVSAPSADEERHWVSGPAVWVTTGPHVRSVMSRIADGHRFASLLIPVERQNDGSDLVVELVSGRQHCENEQLVVAVVGQLGDTVNQKDVVTRLVSAERDFRTAFMDAPVGVSMFRRDGIFEHVNEAFASFLGRSVDDLIDSEFGVISHPDDVADTLFSHGEMLAGRSDGYDAEKRYLHANGSERWGRISVTPVRDEEGDVDKFIALLQDIDDRKRAETDALVSRARLRATFDDSAIAMALVQTDTDHIGIIREANRAFERLTGVEADGINRMRDVIHQDVAGHFDDAVESLAAPDAEPFHSESQVVGAAAGVERWVRLVAAPVRDVALGESYAVVQLEDITEQRSAQHDLARIALHDSLTDLPNRTLILDRIRNAQERTQRSGRHLGLLFLDLDKFKDVNDSLGHDHGDRLLIEIADRLKRAIRPADTAARLGGDEFVILCDELSPNKFDAARELESVATRIHSSLQAPVPLGEIDAYCTTSIGMEVLTGTSVPVETALSNADAAMYRAKTRGRARTEAYNAATRRSALDRLRMASELRQAIDRDEMRVAYQPIVDVHDASVVGAEALLRWTHPVLGAVSPTQFIDVAEDSDLIVRLGDFVLENVCRDVALRHPDDDFYVSVNVSARQLSRYNFVDTYRQRLDQFGLDAPRIALELTENVLMDAAGSSLDQLSELREMGAHVGVDDFGTGYASLTYLKQLPISFVKVDRSFIDGLAHDHDDRSITDAVISLARALDLRVIAEGVETAEQASILGELECGFAQGYHYGRPAVVAA